VAEAAGLDEVGTAHGGGDVVAEDDAMEAESDLVEDQTAANFTQVWRHLEQRRVGFHDY
jgi:hypothetical protein